MVKVSLELFLENKCFKTSVKKYSFRKEVILPREPNVGEEIQVSISLPKNRKINHLVSVVRPILMTEGDEVSRYLVCVEAGQLAERNFMDSILFENCGWEITPMPVK